jgi:transposase
MIIIGIDPHPATLTTALLDASSARVLGTLEVNNSEEGHQLLRHWVHQHSEDDVERRWAVEGACNPFVAPLVAELLAQGEHVTDIPPSLTSQYRSRRGSKKNDAVDASNAAKALVANPSLPAYNPGPNQRRLQVLTRNRARLADDLKANRMALKALPALEDPHADQPREILREIVAYLARQIKRLDVILGELIEEICPRILDLSGVGAVLGATILAEVGNICRFQKESAFASYCGAALVSRGSGKNNWRVSVNSGGNRRMNYVVHMMAQVRLRTDPRSRELFERKQREGKTKRAALRVLKTYIARELYRKLKAFEKNRETLAIGA